jgi:hypothetical protein
MERQTYKTEEQAPQIARAEKFVATNREAAMRVVFDGESPPHGTRAPFVQIALEKQALTDGDFALLQRIASHSVISEQATEYGRESAAWAARDPASPVAAIKSVQAARAAASKTKPADAPKAKRNVVKDMLDAANKEAKQQAKKMKWQSFIHSITCEGK